MGVRGEQRRCVSAVPSLCDRQREERGGRRGSQADGREADGSPSPLATHSAFCSGVSAAPPPADFRRSISLGPSRGVISSLRKSLLVSLLLSAAREGREG